MMTDEEEKNIKTQGPSVFSRILDFLKLHALYALKQTLNTGNSVEEKKKITKRYCLRFANSKVFFPFFTFFGRCRIRRQISVPARFYS